MKTFFSLFILFALSNNASAQVNSYTKYDTCQYLQQYEGTWMAAVGSDTIRICLRYTRTYDVYFNTVLDRLWGWHEFKHGTSIVESNFTHRFMTIPFDKSLVGLNDYSISISLQICNNNTSDNFLVGYIRDSSQAGEIHIVKATLDSTKTIMTWKQNHSAGYGVFSGAYGMTLPSSFVLTKQP